MCGCMYVTACAPVLCRAVAYAEPGEKPILWASEYARQQAEKRSKKGEQ